MAVSFGVFSWSNFETIAWRFYVAMVVRAAELRGTCHITGTHIRARGGWIFFDSGPERFDLATNPTSGNLRMERSRELVGGVCVFNR